MVPGGESVGRTLIMVQKYGMPSNYPFFFISMFILIRHYFPVDFSKFPIPGVQGEGAGEVLFLTLSISIIINVSSKTSRKKILESDYLNFFLFFLAYKNLMKAIIMNTKIFIKWSVISEVIEDQIIYVKVAWLLTFICIKPCDLITTILGAHL